MIFKTLALSTVTFLAQVLVIPNQIVDTLKQTEKDFLWNLSSPKVKHETIYSVAHKNVTIFLWQ